MSLEIVILGCGSSGGVPRGDGDWGACDPLDPRNVRTRCSALVTRLGENGATRVLIERGNWAVFHAGDVSNVAPRRRCGLALGSPSEVLSGEPTEVKRAQRGAATEQQAPSITEEPTTGWSG